MQGGRGVGKPTLCCNARTLYRHKAGKAVKQNLNIIYREHSEQKYIMLTFVL